MNTETTKITAVEVMTTGAEILKMSANEQLVAYGYLMGLLDRSRHHRRCHACKHPVWLLGGEQSAPQPEP